jgi:acetyl-CoA carboxylase biotin carboxyl carrier protein
MNLEEIRQILALVREHELAEFELEQNGLKIRVRKDAMTVPLPGNPGPVVTPAASVPPSPVAVAPSLPPPPSAHEPADVPEDALELAVVKSPIVGTFYRAPEPGASPFVELGTPVKKGQVLCIIEAMKLMNEIESEYEGEVVKVYVENGQPVQYGERLFAIKTK